ncbi:NYN domain-containing protein [Verrucomicrobiota bacterium]
MKDWLIIDGYNLIYQLFPENVHTNSALIGKSRKNLLILLEPLVNLLARKITVVFDGRIEEPSNKDIESEVIDVVYSPPGMSADTIIENLVWKTDHPENILVVTSDRLERNATSASGADTIASSLFIAKLIDEQTRLSDKLKKMNKNHKNITLGDFFNFPPASSD